MFMILYIIWNSCNDWKLLFKDHLEKNVFYMNFNF